MKRAYLFFGVALATVGNCFGFTAMPSAIRALGVSQATLPAAVPRTPSRGMRMAQSNEEKERALANMARAARKVGPNDRVVELAKPMGLVLEEDERGNVYIVEVLPGGNASRKKTVNVGDKIAFVSATFGDQIWSAKGVGLSRVQSAIKLRSGQVKLVLETSKEGQKKMERDAAKLKKKVEDQESAEDKRDRLLRELGDDTKAQKKKGWYGLF